MILIDFSQVFHSSIHILTNLKIDIEEDSLRKILIDFIKKSKKKFRDYGDVVLALDSKSWRSRYFEYYKHNRKKDREDSIIDYDNAFRCFNVVISEFKEHFPYKVIQILGAEGDDVIGILARNVSEDTVIIARDKDFFQLHAKPWIKQYDPITEKMIVIDRNQTSRILFEHICKGDSGDGIPNINSKKDHFVNGEGRQKMITTKNLDKWHELSEDSFKETIGEDAWARFSENRILIDLSKIPQKLVDRVLEEYNTYDIASKRSKLQSYLIKNKMTSLLDSLSELV